MGILVSIIVPVYKVPELFLRQCVESIMNQTLNEIEIILVDDGSPDDCGAICDRYAELDRRINVIHKKNEGLAAARNSGFYAANGEWIMFVDGDDWIERDMCKEMYGITGEGQFDVVLCGMFKDYNHSTIPYTIGFKDKQRFDQKGCKYLQSKILDFNSNIACAYSKLIRRSYLVKNQIEHNAELRQGAEGIEFNLRVFDKAQSAIFINKPLYHYIYNPSSISASFSENNNHFVLNCFSTIKEFINDCEDRKLLLTNFYNRLVFIIITTAVSGYFNPENKDDYRKKVEGYKNYLKNPLIKETMRNANLENVTGLRRITFFLIKYHVFFAVNIIAIIRRIQLKLK